jgi:beta-lactamase regulating signal transducer with metallopeptidase domain
VSLRRLRRNARLIGGRGVKIFQVDGPIIPFSFGNAIYINQRLHTKEEWAEIILHEYVHIRQKHTLDILLAELVCIVNWYNPFAWLIRYSVRHNLEFIADHQVLDKGVDRKGYQYRCIC